MGIGIIIDSVLFIILAVKILISSSDSVTSTTVSSLAVSIPVLTDSVSSLSVSIPVLIDSMLFIILGAGSVQT